ncbi:MAG: bifunctional (p)ppGpp synthetase/guanosine-3',5'-bis(diphosphate) 3'-pyrophosphohydrolase [Pseudomonadota bacterium]|nr:bifunctional (p)ppGpp synthetase/guanosine-3',5'-bis(diphosphate) 3'-pyrophosphohydrolase [Pseudomonadota bacterium]
MNQLLELEEQPSLKNKLTYINSEMLVKIDSALGFAVRAHAGQMRFSGEPYITHPIAVATILAELKMDYKCVIAGLLHDVIEDTEFGYSEVEKRFDKEVADMVDAVTKIEKMPAKSRKENQAENFLKMLMAMSSDIRILMIKLADRLHNMRTLEYTTKEHKKRISRETLDIYAPLARRLGMNGIASELEEIGFKVMYPLRYRTLKKAIDRIEKKHRMALEKITMKIEAALNSRNIAHEYVKSRKKHLYSLYQKMRRKRLSFDEINDVYAIRVCTKKTEDCYTVLGVIHGLYKPMPGRFKDYIAIPKSNGYQSLHTLLFGPSGGNIEAQVRSNEMDQFANMGIAAHNLYKNEDKKITARHKEAQQWLNKLMSMQKKMSNSLEFIEHLKVDLCPDMVYVFTPQGDIIELQAGATVLDFAYAIHTNIGEHCVLGKINQQICPLSTVLQHGQTISVVTKPDSSPDQSWLNFVVTSKAKNAIRHYFRDQRKEDLIQLGWRIVNKACMLVGIEMPKIDTNLLEKTARGFADMSFPDVLENIALGNGSAVVFSEYLLENIKEEQESEYINREEKKPEPLVITGHENLAINYSDCCCPIPGDAITGILVPGEGIYVHRRMCQRLKAIKAGEGIQVMDVEWGEALRQSFVAHLDLHVLNQKGTLATIASAVAKDSGNISDISISVLDENTACVSLTMVIRDRNQLSKIVRRLRRDRCILHVRRVVKCEQKRRRK